MRKTRIVLFSLLVACGTAPVDVPGHGVLGSALTTSLTVHVFDDAGGPIAGAAVDVGGESMSTGADGVATLATTGSSVTLRVVAAGRVTERWIGVDRDRAWVEMVAPVAPRTITGAITGGAADVVVSAATSLTMLRSTSPMASTSACASGACEVTLTVETPGSSLDVVLLDGSAARLSRVVVGGDGRFSVDAAAIASSAPLLTLQASVPSAPDLEAVVGVPGLATTSAVTLFPAFDAAPVSLVAPSPEGPFAGRRLWFVARGTNTDGSGDSLIFDRHVGGDGAVHLPTAFLAIPSATASGTVGIDVDPEVDLYVVEAYAGDSAERALVLHPSGSHIDVPISLVGVSRVVVRAVDTDVTATGIDLDLAESAATRIATIEL